MPDEEETICDCCGTPTPMDESYTCSGCGQTVCPGCLIDVEKELCADCQESE